MLADRAIIIDGLMLQIQGWCGSLCLIVQRRTACVGVFKLRLG